MAATADDPHDDDRPIDPRAVPPRPPRGAPDAVGPAMDNDGGMLGALHRWIADARTVEAARRRRIEHSLRRQAAQDTSVAGVLVDLGERGRPLVLETIVGAFRRGHVVGVGLDFAALTDVRGTLVLVPLDAVCTIRTEPGERPATSGRVTHLDVSLVAAAAEFAGHRPRVGVTTSAASTWSGVLTDAGRDVLVVRLDGDERATVYVPVACLAEVHVTG